MSNDSYRKPASESDPLLPTPTPTPPKTEALISLFNDPVEEEQEETKQNSKYSATSITQSILLLKDHATTDDVPVKGSSGSATAAPSTLRQGITLDRKFITTTLLGALMFLLYHVVFCLAQASSMTRPHETKSSTADVAKMAALGVLFAGPAFIFMTPLPAVYPTSDLFLAPFLSQLCLTIDSVLNSHGLADDDALFWGTFGTLILSGFLLSGLLCIVAARVKLANLGAFLPYSVLCGFFTTIGILIYSLGVSVDTGHSISEIFTSGDWNMIQKALIHHVPSLLIGILMHLVGKASPFLVMGLVVATIFGSYGVMWIFGISLSTAQSAGWFFSPKDLTSDQDIVTQYGPPLPFGVLSSLWQGHLHMEAYMACLPTLLALVLLYLIRSSLHSAALKKNVKFVTREGAKIPKLSLGDILERGYGISQIVAALVGAIPVAPSVAAALTMFQLGADGAAPQYLSCVLLLAFYLTDFSLVSYIPKPAFSCLMVLAGLDMCRTWLIGSYLRTEAKLEWMVAPILVVLAFSVGMLNAIVLGIGLSAFLFVGNFYHTGVVKHLASGRSLRSTVERGWTETSWLDQHGDYIQILVLQNYIFFGNAQSVFSYISTMFDEVEHEDHRNLENGNGSGYVIPVPKYLVVDFTLSSGMDTSAVDVFREAVDLCQDNNCQMIMSGLKTNLKSMLRMAGVKTGIALGYSGDLESALARAEDGLLTKVFHLEDKDKQETEGRRRHRSESNVEDGFAYALQKIDEQHGLDTATQLRDLGQFTTIVELQPGDILYRDGMSDQGLYFVETGLMRVSNSTVYSTLTGHNASSPPTPMASIGHLNARDMGLMQNSNSVMHSIRHDEQSFRVARIGQGWVIGSTETAASGRMRRPGVHVAVSYCRLHHLPISTIQAIEETTPAVTMKLYKTLAHLSTKRQEMTIEQLEQFARILTAPLPRLQGGGRKKLSNIQNLS